MLPGDLPVSQIWRVGDMLALTGVVVASLGLVRSHTVLLVLGQGNPVQRVLPLLGIAGAVVAWGYGVRALEWVGGRWR